MGTSPPAEESEAEQTDETPSPETPSEPVLPSPEPEPEESAHQETDEKPAPESTPSGWDTLATELGIEPRPPAEPSSEKKAAEPPFQKKIFTKTKVERQSKPRDEIAKQPFGYGLLDETTEVRVETAEFVGGSTDAEPALSAGQPSEGVKQTPSRRRRMSRDVEDAAEELSEAGFEDSEEFEADQTDEVSDAVEEESVSGEPGNEEGKAEKRRPKRRRRRAPGRKQEKTADSESPADVIGASDADVSDVEPEKPSKKEKRSRCSKKSKPDSEDEERDKGAKKKAKHGHRAIPTWEEAIGLIIDSNLEKRPKRTGDGSRGRGKGGKGRGASKDQTAKEGKAKRGAKGSSRKSSKK